MANKNKGKGEEGSEENERSEQRETESLSGTLKLGVLSWPLRLRIESAGPSAKTPEHLGLPDISQLAPAYSEMLLVVGGQ